MHEQVTFVLDPGLATCGGHLIIRMVYYLIPQTSDRYLKPSSVLFLVCANKRATALNAIEILW